MEEIYASTLAALVEEISDALERDRFFTPEEALEYGMIDGDHGVAERERERPRARQHGAS